MSWRLPTSIDFDAEIITYYVWWAFSDVWRAGDFEVAAAWYFFVMGGIRTLPIGATDWLKSFLSC